MKTRNVYSFEYAKPNGEIIKMKEFEGKAILIVNTATKCGLSPQFAGLENLWRQYKDQGLVVIGFPCSQFLNQEPVEDSQMVDICNTDFGVTFPLSAKIKVNGSQQLALFKFLKESLPGVFGSMIKWNFTKFLIDRYGQPYMRFSPTTKPEELEKHIKLVLKHI